MSSGKVVDYTTINEYVKRCKYEVRGEIYLAAVKRAQSGKEVIYTNVGNPHALGQTPLTFPRQVLSLMMSPFLLKDPRVLQLFPSDAIERAKLYLTKVIRLHSFCSTRHKTALTALSLSLSLSLPLSLSLSARWRPWCVSGLKGKCLHPPGDSKLHRETTW
jgi:hypothetical protein